MISIRGTNRVGAFEPRFNPPLSNEGSVFGALGVYVLSDWPSEDRGWYMSGCSVATSIAVAVAVMLLEYATAQPSDSFRSDDLRLMRTCRGVFEVLKGMLFEVRVHYRAPWFLLSLGFTNPGVSGRNWCARRELPVLHRTIGLFKLSAEDILIKLKSAIGRHPSRV